MNYLLKTSVSQGLNQIPKITSNSQFDRNVQLKYLLFYFQIEFIRQKFFLKFNVNAFMMSFIHKLFEISV